MVRLNPKDVNGWSTRPMHNEGITSVAMDARGKLIAVGGEDATIRFVNAKSASRDDKKILEGHAGPVTALAFDPKGSLLVSGSDDGSLRVWRASSGKQRLEVGGHDARLGGLAVDPKGRWIAAGYGDGVLKILDLKKGEELATLMREDSGPISGLEFVGKSATLAVANGFDVLTFWDLSGL